MRGRPVADVRALVEDLYQTTYPMDFTAVLDNPIEFHPLATDAATGQSVDLRPLLAGPAELRLALRASAALPLLAGPPVQFAGRRFYDAGVSDSVPYRTALDQGATHVLVLRSRMLARPARPGGRAPLPARLFARLALRRETPALRAAFLSRDSRLAASDQLLAGYETGAEPPAVLSIRPAPGSPEVSRLATDGALLQGRDGSGPRRGPGRVPARPGPRAVAAAGTYDPVPVLIEVRSRAARGTIGDEKPRISGG